MRLLSALAFEDGLLLGVEGGGVVLEVLHERAGLGALIEDLRLALVDGSAPFHGGPTVQTATGL